MEHLATTRRRIGLIVLLLLLSGGEAYAQSLSADARSRLAPRLRSVAAEQETANALGPLLSPVREEKDLYGVFVYVEDRDALSGVDLPLTPVAPTLATARVTPAELRTLSEGQGVTRIVAARQYAPLNDVARGVTGAHPLHTGRLGRRYTGEGVLACVIDSGIDWTHLDFRRGDDTTRTRIRALWDQTLSARGGDQSPEALGYGVEYTRSDLEAALGSAGTTVRSVDTLGHGTQVAATVAGNGRAHPTRMQRGMAPKAGIVAVKTDFSGGGIADGLRYCDKKAEAAGRPMVVNLSLGTSAGPHDGSSALARTVDAVSGAGRSVVVAAGNGGDSNRHVSRSLSGGGVDSLTVRVPDYAPKEGASNDIAFHLDTWIDGREAPSVAMVAPSGRRVSLTPDSAAALRMPDGTVAYEYARSRSGDWHVELAAYDAAADTPPALGDWTVVMENQSSEATTVHGWMVKTTTGSTLRTGNSRSTMTTPATARSALAVGAWTHRTRRGMPSNEQGAVAPFSSRGPLRGGGQEPDLVAPGQWTISARSQFAKEAAQGPMGGSDYTLYRGTSAASAATAGAAALLLEQDRSLSSAQIAALLTDHAQPVASDGRSRTAQSGHGRLDVYGAMAHLTGTSVTTRERIGDEDPASPKQWTTHELGGRGARALALRFTPEQSGVVDGLFVRTAVGIPNQLRDSLRVALHASDGGSPGSQIGTDVQVPPDAFKEHTSNFVSLAGTEAVVTAGEEYHLVLSVEENAGTLTFAGERQSVDGSFLRRQNGEWTSLSADLALQVSTSFALDLDAPRLTGPESKAIVEDPASPTLSWRAVSKADTYTVQVASAPGFPSAQTDTFQTEARSLTLSDLASSTGYFWRVRAERLGYSGSWSRTRSFLYYPATVSVRASRSFGASGNGAGFRLVALPGRQARPLDETVKGRPGTDWEAYRDRGGAKAAFAPFDGSSAFSFRPGTGFWLRGDRGWQVRTSVRSVPLDEDGTYTIPLREGWNVISNPFDLDVSWSAVEAQNGGSLPPLWRFSGSFEQATTFASARNGEAFYVLNDRGLDRLQLPYPAFPGEGRGRVSSKKIPPALTLTAVQGGVSAHVHVGTHDDATSGRDEYDRVAPPARFSQPSFRLASSGENLPSRQQHLAAEYRSTNEDGHSFSLSLRASPDEPLTIRAEGLSAFDDQKVVLVDPAAGESYDLRTASTFPLPLDTETRSLRLLIGSADYVETKKRVALPSELQFLPNYPNPFGDQTTLEYVLPKPSLVRVTVYDVLGRQVRVLVDEQQQAGRHTVQWDGRGESGHRMASGVYLARLVVGGTTKVRKMTFVR